MEMEVSCKELRKRAWDRLSKGTNYSNSLGVSVIGSIVGSIGGIFTLGAASAGMAKFYVAQQRDEKHNLEMVFSGFNDYVKNLALCFFQMLFTFLWALLLWVPGIIYTLATSMAYYVREDNPNLTASEALERSKELMNGYKWKFFKLRLSFIGWILLAALTGGIGSIFLAPYMSAADAEFYAELLKCHGISAAEADGKQADQSQEEKRTPDASEVFDPYEK